MHFDLIDADWIDAQNTDLYDVQDPERVERAWSAWRRRAAEENFQAEDPLATAPLTTLELDVPFHLALWQAQLGLVSRPAGGVIDPMPELINALQERWYALKLTSRRSANVSRARLRRSVFDRGITVYCSALPATTTVSASLSAISAFTGLPVLTDVALAKHMREVNADFLAVYDVGQANANSLLNYAGSTGMCSDVYPAVYFDLGMPVGKNKGTAPAGVRFCFTVKPPIVLSHWHEDHFVGVALASGISPLTCRWIVPEQTVTIKHTALMTAILAAGGAVTVFTTAPANALFSCDLGVDKRMYLSRGQALDKNCSGIVMAVRRKNNRQPVQPSSLWILPGDCDYHYFAASLKGVINSECAGAAQAIVAPHHGGNLRAGSIVIPAAGKYRRLIYSFGRDNSYLHARTPFSVDHHAAGWKHLVAAGIPSVQANALDVIATNVNNPMANAPAGAVVSWAKPCPAVNAACAAAGANCNVPLLKS